MLICWVAVAPHSLPFEVMQPRTKARYTDSQDISMDAIVTVNLLPPLPNVWVVFHVLGCPAGNDPNDR